MPNEITYTKEMGVKTTQAYIRNGTRLSGPLSVSNVTASEIRTNKIWVRTPNFVYKKRTKSLPVNGYSIWRSIDKKPSGSLKSVSAYYPDEWSVSTGILGSYGAESRDWPPSDDLVNQLKARINAKLLNKIKDQKINLAQAYAERAQTLKLVESTILRFVNVLRMIRRGDLRQASSLLGVNVSRRKLARFRKEFKSTNKNDLVGNWWLELQYGWKPLLSDIVGAAELIAKQNLDITRSQATHTGESSYNDEIQLLYPNALYVHRVEGTIRYSVGVKFAVTDTALKAASETGLSNPLLLAWELLPYSFVVDWFLPVGNYLGTLDATLGVTFNQGYSSVKIKYQSSCDMTGMGSGEGSISGKISSTKTYQSFVRDQLGNFPSPTFPSIKNPFSLEHFANAVALLRGAFSRH